MNKILVKLKKWLIELVSESSAVITSPKPIIEWSDIPAGTFLMGSKHSEPLRKGNERPHEVTLSAFKLAKYQVTVKQFQSFVIATGYITDAEFETGGYSGSNLWLRSNWRNREDVCWKHDPTGFRRPLSAYDHPVVHVSWNDAKAFAEWMDCRLPTEAEWEYSCRAGTISPFFTGDNITSSQATYDGQYPYHENPKGDSYVNTTSVGSHLPNPWGLYDMNGNVWEWCEDWYGVYLSTAQIDPLGPSSGELRVNRGGSWRGGANRCRSARRGSGDPFYRAGGIGFRVAYK